MARYKVSIVNYLNAAPFVEGLQGDRAPEIDILLDHPSQSAQHLLDGTVDIALAPVAILSGLSPSYLIGQHCIGSEGEVKTVKLFSDVPVQEIRRIYLDYQSRTSVLLVQILCAHHWKITPEFVPAYPGFQKDIYGSHAGLVIGDRAIRVLGRYPYEYDLGQCWTDMTELPFVFAAWISGKPIDEAWASSFDRALSAGLDRRDEIAKKYRHLNSAQFSVEQYLHHHISYSLDDAKRRGLAKFREMCGTLSPLE